MSSTERRRPEFAPGATVDGLSVPQQEFRSDPQAEPTHQVAPIAAQENSWPICCRLYNVIDGIILEAVVHWKSCGDRTDAKDES